MAADEDLKMEQTVAEPESLLSDDQQIDHQNTCINGPIGSDSHIQENVSESSDPRRRAGLSSFQNDHLIRDTRVCRDFVRGQCARGRSCRFGHSESDAQEGYRPKVCNDFLADRCNRVSCKFLHPDSDRSNGCGSTGKDNLGTAANSEKSQFYGENAYHDPRNSSFPRGNRSRSPCQRFQNGMCYRGESCSYLHSDYAAFNISRNDYSTPLQQGAVTTSRYRDTQWSSQEHEEAKEGNGISTRLSSREHRSKSPARSFLRGRYYSSAASPYYHSDTYPRSRNDEIPPWRRGSVATSGNPGFGRGRVDMSFSAGQRSRSPCRDFIRGKCDRGAHCPFLHTNAVTSENSSFREGSVRVTSRTESIVGSDQISRSFSSGYGGKSPCRDYLNGRCPRGSRCPYLHLDNDTRVTPKDVCTTQQAHEVAETSENLGLVEHDDANMDEDLRSNCFPRQSRSRSPCRKFLSGRCYRGASCYYLHPETHDRSRDVEGYEQNRYRGNTGITPRSWSTDRQQSRPLGNLGIDKTRPEVCLKYCKGRCTLGESCRYLHSFHEYAKSASDCKSHFESSGGMHQRDPSLMQEELDGSFDEKTIGKNADNAEKPNITDAKDEVAVGEQQKCEVSGEATARNCDFSEVDEKNNLCLRSFKRRRSSSRSPSGPSDDIDGRRTRRYESQDNFHWQSSRSGSSPLTPRGDVCRNIREESYNNFPRGRCHNVAPFRYPYSHSYRYNGPRYYMNKEPQSSSQNISGNPNAMETQGRNEVVSHEMQLASSTQIVNSKNGAESVTDAVQPSTVDHGSDELVRGCEKRVILEGEKNVGSEVASDTNLCGEIRYFPMDTDSCTLNKDGNAEVDTHFSKEGSEKSNTKKQETQSRVRKMDIKSCSESSLSQPDTLGVRVSDNTLEVVTISLPVVQPGQGNEVVTMDIENNVSVQGTANEGSSVGHSVKSTISSPRRKLLVLDVNGLLADIVNIGEVPRGYKPDTIIAMKAVFKRPFCDDFLEFCFDRFDVGIWSSRNKKNVDRVLDFLMFNTKKRLLFCWDQAHCTETGYKTIENRDKPLVLKELKKLWEKQVTDLPWEKGFYDETNTVLLDDSPYKALCNPSYTAIFPYAYKYRDTKDRSLGRGGDLRVYLEKLVATDNIQKFIEGNPFGQRAITKSNLSWGFYSKIIRATQQEGISNNASAMEISNNASAMEVAISHSASQQERDVGSSTRASSAGDHTDRQKEKADCSISTKNAADHTQQSEGNATKDLGAHLDREDRNVHNTLSTRENQLEGNADTNSDTKVVANETQLEENSDKTIAIKVAATANRQEGNSDYSTDTNFVAHETQQEGNAGNNSDTRVVAHEAQLEGNSSNTTDVKVVVDKIWQEGNVDNSADADFVAHETQQERNARNNSDSQVVAHETQLEGNSNNANDIDVVANESQEEGNDVNTNVTHVN